MMKKRWLTILTLIISMGCCGTLTSCRGGALGESLQFQENLDEKGYSVIGMGTVSTVNLTIPYVYNFSPVVEIGDAAFMGEEYLKSVKIPDTVTRIGDSAFSECSNLEKVNLGKGVQTIGMNAFAACSSLKSVKIPDSVICIDMNAFGGCINLTTLSIGDGVSEVTMDMAFYGCNNLSEVSAPASVWMSIPKTNLEKAIITSGEEIKDKLFSGATNLRSVDISKSITTIGNAAFENCTSLTSINIPSAVVSIADDAFKGCSSLTNISVAKDNPAYQSIDGNLYKKEGNVFMWYASGKEETSFTIPDVVKKIGSSAFLGCNNLTNIIMPNGVVRVGWSAFRYCDNLRLVELSDTVTTIDVLAFADCKALTSVVIGEGMEDIGWGAFRGCDNLTAVYYKGKESEWDEIAIDHYNEALIEAMRYYYDESETANCWWHYDEDGEIVHA